MISLKKILFLMLACSVVTFWSCEDDEADTTKPSVTLTSPTDGQTFNAGSTIGLDGTVFDDSKLADWRVSITPDFTDLPKEGFQYTFEDNSASGTAYSTERNIEIPSTTGAGPHTLTLFAVDDAVNVSDTTSITINIVNPEDTSAPTITITGPPNPDVPTAADAGGSNDIYVTGDVADDLGLAKMMVSWEYADSLSADSMAVAYSNDIYPYTVELGETAYSIAGNAAPYFIAPTELGEFNLLLTIWDQYNNVAEQRIRVNVNK